MGAWRVAHVGVIDGRDARSEGAFFTAVAGALELPEWFGSNWDALDEVLADRSWPAGAEHVLVVRHAGRRGHPPSALRRRRRRPVLSYSVIPTQVRAKAYQRARSFQAL